jgi:hypothetical protein
MPVVALAVIVAVVALILVLRGSSAPTVEPAVRDRRGQRRTCEYREPVCRRRVALGERLAGAEAPDAAAVVAVHQHR